MTKPLPTELQALLDNLEDARDRRYGSAELRDAPLRQRATRTRRTAIRLAGAAAIAAVAAGVLLTRTAGPGAVAKAIASVGATPTGMVVHFLSVSTDSSGHVTQRTELWAATGPPYAERSILQGSDGQPIEQGATGDELTQYDPAGVVYVRTIAGGLPQGNHAADFAPTATEIKQYLSAYPTSDDGIVVADGVRLHRFTINPPEGGRCTYDVAADTFFARRFVCTGLATGAITERWDYLARQGNDALLSVTAQHPDARVDVAHVQACSPGVHTAATPPCIATAPGG